MKMKTIASAVLPLVLMAMPPLSHAGLITFDFFDLIENQSSDISGRLGDGSDHAGPALATTYEYLTWNKGVTLTARTLYELYTEEPGYDPADYVSLHP